MIRDTVEGLPVERRAQTAASEGVTGNVTSVDPGRQSGWDPYEVWRTRIKTLATAPPAEKRPAAQAPAVETGPIR